MTHERSHTVMQSGAHVPVQKLTGKVSAPVMTSGISCTFPAGQLSMLSTGHMQHERRVLVAPAPIYCSKKPIPSIWYQSVCQRLLCET